MTEGCALQSYDPFRHGLGTAQPSDWREPGEDSIHFATRSAFCVAGRGNVALTS
jgi:hypothetical protein